MVRVSAEMTPFRVSALLVEIVLGYLTFTGSVIAAGKLQEVKWIPQRPWVYPGQNLVNGIAAIGAVVLAVMIVMNPTAPLAPYYFGGVIVLSLIFGPMLVLPIGGADMPTVIAILNSYAGLSAVAMGFVLDNKLLIIQMRGADVQSVPGSSYGSVTSYNDAGNYEFCRISSVNGNVLTLSKPLSRTYNPAGKVQVVRVPEFRNYTLADTLYCPQWNDTVYGVVALAVVDTLHLVAPIIANGSGFPGGLVVNAKSTDSTHLDVYFGAEDSSRYALKGQGIASFLSAEHRAGRGALAIAGGGGNNHNAGGGGGANGGCGGKGGYGWDEMKAGNNLLAQGLGGYAADNTTNKLFMGGGGGAGHSNERTGTSGGNGGGIVIIDARYIAAEGGTIFANGITAGNAPYDGAGGGGAGGTVLLKTSAILGQLTIEAQGGNGGKVAIHRDGPGGGGGGGVVCFSLPATPTGATIVNTGGYAGTSRNFEEYGQSDGCTGVQRTNIEIPGDNTILSVSSAPDEEASAPHVYPQPARDMVTLLPPNGSPAAKRCSLFDMLGHHVGEGTMTDTGAWMLDVSTLLSGVYVATLYTATGGIPVRVLVKP